MPKAKQGDTVKIHYTGKLHDGSVFDSSTKGDPLQLTIGKPGIIPGFQQAVIGMNTGESKIIKIPADNAYGPYLKEMVVDVEKKRLPKGLNPQIGQHLRINQEDGRDFIVKVLEVSETHVKLDGNHPLAGKDLTFEIELLEIN